MKSINYALMGLTLVVLLWLASQLGVDIKMGRDNTVTIEAWVGWFILLLYQARETKYSEEYGDDEQD